MSILQENNIEAVIFDMDGVIIDSELVHMEIELDLLRERGLLFTEEDFASCIGSTMTGMWQKIIAEHNLDCSLEETVGQALAKRIERLELGDIRMIDGVDALIRAISRRNLKLAVASSSHPEYIRRVLTTMDLTPYFDVVVSSEQVSRAKPAPDVFLLAAEKLGVEARCCLVIEDSSHGVKAALAAGMYCIGYENPNSPGQSVAAAHRQAGSHAAIGELL